MFRAKEYVDKLLQILGKKQSRTVHHCYVATDDHDATIELKLALKQAHVNCKVSSLATGQLTGRDRVQPSESLRLMTDLFMLAQATYFIGSFNSNIGSLAAVLRSCHSKEDSILPHFGFSYGVDQDDWMLR